MELRKLLGYFIMSIPLITICTVLTFLSDILVVLQAVGVTAAIVGLVVICVHYGFDLSDGR